MSYLICSRTRQSSDRSLTTSATKKRPRDPIWFWIAFWIVLFVAMMATGHGQETSSESRETSDRTLTSSATKPRVVYVGATWCQPCAGAKKFTIPAIAALGVNVEQLDYDRDADKCPGEVTDVPTWFVIGADGRVLDVIVGHVHQHTILKKFPGFDGRHIIDRGAAASSPARQEPRPPGPGPPAPDVVAQLRRFLGTNKPRSHSSIAWQFEESLDIVLDPKTKLTRPKHLAAEFDFRDDVLVVTFAEPLPQAHVVKAGATLSVDVPRVTIKGNVVTATADVAFGIQKDFEFTITKSPFDE